jgi:hypothetical protein
VAIRANHPPVARDGHLATREDTRAHGRMVAIDPNGDPLTYRIISNGSKGTVTITDASRGRFTYVPQAKVTGHDSFTFRANDGLVDSNLATIHITITPPR